MWRMQHLRVALFLVVIGVVGPSWNVFAEFSPAACRLAVLNLEGLRLTEYQKDFFENVLGPALGRRAFLSGPDRQRIRRSQKYDFKLSSFKSSPDLFIDFLESGIRNPRIEVKKEGWVLSIPRHFDFSKFEDQGIGLIRRLLVGHNLNTFTPSSSARAERKKLGEQELVRRRVQRDGSRAAIESSRAFDAGDKTAQRFIYVAPTGSGKSLVIQDVLEERLKPKTAEIHFVVTDRVHHMEDRRKDSMKFKKDAVVISMGGDFSAKDLMDLVKRAKRARKPMILTTTIQSLDRRLAELSKEDLKSLRALLRTFVYDEAHHGGAPRSMTAIQKLIDPTDSKAFLFGTTATPLHPDQDIEAIFGNRAYWAYLDTAKSFRSTKGAFIRPLEDIREQLARAIEAGELTEVRRPYFINASRFIEGQPELFTKGDEERYRIRSDLQPQVAARLMPAMAQHKRGFIVASTIDEANEMGLALQTAAKKAHLPHRIEVMHSGLPNHSEILERFKSGKIDYLVVVNQLDEAIDIPDLSLYIDLTRSLSARELLQRLGRILRLSEGKRFADFITFFDFNQVDLTEMLLLVDAMTKGRFHYDPLGEIGRAYMRMEEINQETSDSDNDEGGSGDVEVNPETSGRLISGDFELTDEEFAKAMKDFQRDLQRLLNQKERGFKAVARDLNAFVAEHKRLPISHWQKKAESRLRSGLLRYRELNEFRALLSEEVLALEAQLGMRHRSVSERTTAAVNAANAFVLKWKPSEAPFLPAEGLAFVDLPRTQISYSATMEFHEAFKLIRKSPAAMKQLSPRAQFMVNVLERIQFNSGGDYLMDIPRGTYSVESMSTHDNWINLYRQELRKLGWENLDPEKGGILEFWLNGMKAVLEKDGPSSVVGKISGETWDLLGIKSNEDNYLSIAAKQIEALFKNFRSEGSYKKQVKIWEQLMKAAESSMLQRWDRRDDFMAMLSPEAKIVFEILRLEHSYFSRTNSRVDVDDKRWNRRIWGFILERERLVREAGLNFIPIVSPLYGRYFDHVFIQLDEDSILHEKLLDWYESGMLNFTDPSKPVSESH